MKKSPTAARDTVVRFSVGQRVEHFLLMVSFTMLVITGLPQKLYYMPWTSSIVLSLGGIDMVRLLHRIFAVIFIAQSVYHVACVLVGMARKRLKLTMMPQWKDVTDAWTMLRYCIGLAPAQPQFGRYTYREKFEYWGVVFGGAVMIATGLVLWFPILATRYLPGELIPACKEAHSGEALLAFLVIVVWHLYGVHLTPIHFPGDVSIFTGRITRERMIEEHPLEYAEWTGVQPSPVSVFASPDALEEVPREELGREGGDAPALRDAPVRQDAAAVVTDGESRPAVALLLHPEPPSSASGDGSAEGC